MHTGLCGGHLKVVDYLEDVGMYSKIILKWILNLLDLINLADNRDKW